ncbi:4'-phosphopantetheinyl transferase [Streptomyces sp. NPDC004111]|uniref:4'-phosphopantetheinyl transferase family protein n=1 Tax=Streptomyces sp. NPDC004111 TaxID=3364690 RepID=UPI00369EB3FC
MRPPAPPLLARILPAGTAVAESFGDPRPTPPRTAPGTPRGEDPLLHPAERAHAATLRAPRRAEFTSVRHCARRAGRQLGLPPFPLLPGPAGAPRWPAGTVGSLTHCPGYRGAALARDTHLRALGVDAEPHRPLPPGMLERIALPEELHHQEELRAQDGAVRWDRLLFCAKEAVYKVWSPLTGGGWLGFHEASVRIERSPPALTARLLRAAPRDTGPPPPAVLRGSWLAEGGLLLAALAVPR